MYVNADEPVEIRRSKARLRKAAMMARQAGETVESRHDNIMIGETTYTLDDIQKIPSKYLEAKPDDEEQGACGGPLQNEIDMEDTEKRDRVAMARRRIKNPKGTGIIREGERMRITPAGLLFSGPTAYPSNMYEIPVIVDDKEYKSNEMAYQNKKANHHNYNELAEAEIGHP